MSSDPIGEKPRDLALHREAVGAFARAMIAKLDANRHKVSWREQDLSELVKRFDDEVAELRAALESGTREELLGECVDVANLCCFIFDVMAGPSLRKAGGDHG